MKNNFISEIIVSGILISLVVFLLNPFGAWMPDMAVMSAALALIIFFAFFASFIWKESARDEREALHRLIAGRIAFLAGSAALVVGIVIQSLRHDLDIWLVISLVIMVLAKLIGLIYTQSKH